MKIIIQLAEGKLPEAAPKDTRTPGEKFKDKLKAAFNALEGGSIEESRAAHRYLLNLATYLGEQADKREPKPQEIHTIRLLKPYLDLYMGSGGYGIPDVFYSHLTGPCPHCGKEEECCL